ncbi:MAG: carboxylic ester hydrolase [Caldilinea sp. CFX5]|nr:carboxylic ester hydrolase [Caldilinea sp. CFX5]
MRPLETLLIVTNLLTFFVLALPLSSALRWLRYVALLALLIAGAQVLVEGPRWQMVPAYALTIIFFLLWLLGSVIPGGLPVNRLAALLGVIVGVLVLGIAVALPMLAPVFHFPTPTGPYAIGTLTHHWVDRSRAEDFGLIQVHRELMVQIWYPAQNAPAAPRAPYVEQPAGLVTLARLARLPGFIFNHFRYVTTNAIPSAPVADDEPRYPVLIFMSGRGGYRQSNTAQIEELVSHGYVVAAIDQPYASSGVVFPDGRLVTMDPRMFDPARPGHPPFFDRVAVFPYLAQDVSFTLDQLAALNQADPNGILTGRLDLQRVGVFGVSLGGIATGEACRLEPRVRACLVLDAAMPVDVVQSGLQQPVMWLSREAQWMQLEGWKQADIDETQTSMRTVYESLLGDGYLVLVPGMFHVNFSDAPYFSPVGSQVSFTGPIDGQRGLAIVKAYSLAFFDKELKGQPAPLLNGPSSQFPEVIFSAKTR